MRRPLAGKRSQQGACTGSWRVSAAEPSPGWRRGLCALSRLHACSAIPTGASPWHACGCAIAVDRATDGRQLQFCYHIMSYDALGRGLPFGGMYHQPHPTRAACWPCFLPDRLCTCSEPSIIYITYVFSRGRTMQASRALHRGARFRSSSTLNSAADMLACMIYVCTVLPRSRLCTVTRRTRGPRTPEPTSTQRLAELACMQAIAPLLACTFTHVSHTGCFVRNGTAQ